MQFLTTHEVLELLEDRLLILQIAFSMVADSPCYDVLSLDARIEEVRHVYEKLSMLIGDTPVQVKSIGIQ